MAGIWRRLKKKALYSTTPFSSSDHSCTLRSSLLRPNNTAHRHCHNADSVVLLEGKPIAREIKARVAAEVGRMKAAIGGVPGLGVVLVGNKRDSLAFIRLKLRACDEVGISTSISQLPENCKEDELITVVSSLNNNPSVHGIIVQLPLPQHLDEERIVSALSPEKDVDGFHPLNMGNLAMRGREPLFVPCAPMSCIELLLRFGVKIFGKKTVVIGRSKIVGLPTSLLLQRHHATVTTVHAFTKNPELITREADILVSDVGVPNMVRGDWIKEGAVVVDMGTNSIQ
ncbi:Tetrahydrofolate dehydrogenase/cyclohydrolase, partial [Trema orientale]